MRAAEDAEVVEGGRLLDDVDTTERMTLIRVPQRRKADEELLACPPSRSAPDMTQGESEVLLIAFNGLSPKIMFSISIACVYLCIIQLCQISKKNPAQHLTSTVVLQALVD